MSTTGTNVDHAALRARNLKTVGALAALFLLPLVASFLMYFGGYRPQGQSSYGELIDPPRPLPAITLPRMEGEPARVPAPGQWLLVYVGDGACGGECRRALYVMRQTRLALNQNMARVDRALLATRGCCDAAFLSGEHPGLEVLDATGATAQPLLEALPDAQAGSFIYVVDPLGNLVMRHDAASDPRGLLADLKKLLKLSRIG